MGVSFFFNSSLSTLISGVLLHDLLKLQKFFLIFGFIIPGAPDVDDADCIFDPLTESALIVLLYIRYNVIISDGNRFVAGNG